MADSASKSHRDPDETIFIDRDELAIGINITLAIL